MLQILSGEIYSTLILNWDWTLSVSISLFRVQHPLHIHDRLPLSNSHTLISFSQSLSLSFEPLNSLSHLYYPGSSL